MLATRAALLLLLLDLWLGQQKCTDLTVRKEKATKEIAEIFSLSFPQIADKIQRRGLQ